MKARLNDNGGLQVESSPGGCFLRVTAAGETVASGCARPAGLGIALGLCVIGTEVHDSSRITLQLNGRSGRQGRFGLAQTFLCLEDRLVNLDAEAILKLTACRQTDASGRVFFAGQEVSRRTERLQAAADREGETQRSFMQDYAAELDRQTHLYHQRRRELMGSEGDTGNIAALWSGAAARVASRLAAAHLGPDTDDHYASRFGAMSEELRQDYGADCSSLYGLDLSLVPGALEALLVDRVESRSRGAGDGVFPEIARLLYLRVCGDLWPAHVSLLRDSVASQLLSGRYHKSAVAMYISRCEGYWREFWERVEAEFLSRLATMPLAPVKEPASRAASVSAETVRLLATD